MKSKIKTTISIIFFITIISVAKSQDYSEQAKIFFGKHLDNKALAELIKNSLPTLDDCKLIFKGQNAYTYYGYIEDLKKKWKPKSPRI